MKGGNAGTLRKTERRRFGATATPDAWQGSGAAPNGAGHDVGIGFRYAPKRYALRAPLGLRSSRRPHRARVERRQEEGRALGDTELQKRSFSEIEIADLDAHN